MSTDDVKKYEDDRAGRLADILTDDTEDDERCDCRRLTGNSRHVPECDLADNDEYDAVRDEGHA